MMLHLPGIEPDAWIPQRFAFAAPDPDQHIRLSDNLNPGIQWSDLPPGTRSLVLICHDPDVPSEGQDVNQEGRRVPASLPRVDFYHWLLVDIDPAGPPIAEGEFSHGVTAGGKPGPAAPRNARQGINDYTVWFADDAAMQGEYYGYDGPCPPWNDELPHRYIFTLYALDVERCPVDDRFDGKTLLSALHGHVLASTAVTGRYSLNPAVLKAS